MSQDFSFKYDRMRENDPTVPNKSGEEKGHSGERYETVSNTRNLSFVWPDGRCIFVNYSYLICCEYMPAAGMLMLTFTTHVFNLKGARLDNLYKELMAQLIRVITCVDVRYNALIEKEEFAVNEIAVEKNG